MAFKGNDEYMHHLQVKKGDVGRYVLLPGDPFRTDLIARYLDNAKLVAHSREHKTWTGFLSGEPVSVTSTGMGCPSAAIAMEELIKAGADTFIRIGTSGPVCDKARAKEVDGVIATASVRDEGTSLHYIPAEYPAVATLAVTTALIEAAKRKQYCYLEGIIQTKDSFYGEVEPLSSPNYAWLMQRWSAWQAGNVLCSDMESSILFVLASIRGCRAGSILSLNSVTPAIEIACEALKLIIAQDLLQKSTAK